MTKSELLEKLRNKHPDMSAKHMDAAVNVIFNTIIDTVAHGRRVELRNFGIFSTSSHKAKTGRNPKTGEILEVQAKTIPTFRMGKRLFERINSKV